MITLEETSLQHNLKEDEASITKKIKRALEKHKDDAEADPVRESEERTKAELAAMQTKIDKLTDMIQKLVPKDANPAAPGAPATDEASQEPQDLE